jgi:hypothetical protein
MRPIPSEAKLNLSKAILIPTSDSISLLSKTPTTDAPHK